MKKTPEALTAAVCEWTYDQLRGEKPHQPFPMTDVEVNPFSRTAPIKPKSRRAPATNELLARLQKLTQAEAHDDSDSVATIHEVGDLIKHLQAGLVALAEKDSPHAAQTLAHSALDAVESLSQLGHSKPELVKTFSRSWSVWPVLYDGRPTILEAIEQQLADLEVGTQSAQRHGRPSDQSSPEQPYRHVAAEYAKRIGFTLQQIHADAQRVEFIVRFTKKRRCLCPEWILRLVGLPPLTKESARDWFDVGWDALKESSLGSPANIKELGPIGETNAAERKRAKYSARIQEQAREKQIRSRLRDAFCVRFGN